MRGFTLVEVLVVLMVVMLGVSIVTPDLFRIYERIEAQSEEKMVREILKNIGLTAFASQTPQKVSMSGNELAVMPEKALESQKKSWAFKRLTFPGSTEIHFNSRGVPDQEQIEIEAGGQRYTHGLQFWGASDG